MRKFLILLPILATVLALVVLSSGIVSGKAHVPAGKVQVSHKGKFAININASSLADHLGHGDIQLPACDFNNVFVRRANTSNVVSADFTGVTYSNKPFRARIDAGGVTPACPPGTY